MKSALKRLFIPTQSLAESLNIEQEEAFYSKKLQYKRSKVLLNFQKSSSKKLNPMNKNGQISCCVICDSKMHWTNNCPHQDSNNELINILEQKAPQNELPKNYNFFEQYEEINIVLITGEINKNEVFVAEACKSAVVDSACTKTVAGEIWYENYIKSLPNKYRSQIESFPSKTIFKFGDGRKVTAMKRVIFLVFIAPTNCKINAEIMKENIPLLLSKLP